MARDVYVEFPRMLLARMGELNIDGPAGLVDAMARGGCEIHYSSAYQWTTGAQVPSGPRLHALMDVLKLPVSERERMAFLVTLPKRELAQDAVAS